MGREGPPAGGDSTGSLTGSSGITVTRSRAYCLNINNPMHYRLFFGVVVFILVVCMFAVPELATGRGVSDGPIDGCQPSVAVGIWDYNIDFQYLSVEGACNTSSTTKSGTLECYTFVAQNIPPPSCNDDAYDGCNNYWYCFHLINVRQATNVAIVCASVSLAITIFYWLQRYQNFMVGSCNNWMYFILIGFEVALFVSVWVANGEWSYYINPTGDGYWKQSIPVTNQYTGDTEYVPAHFVNRQQAIAVLANIFLFFASILHIPTMADLRKWRDIDSRLPVHANSSGPTVM